MPYNFPMPVRFSKMQSLGNDFMIVDATAQTFSPSPEVIARLVARYAADEAPVLRRDFRNSLCAAFTPPEARAQRDEAGLSQLAVAEISDRHLIVCGRLD